MNPTPCPDCTDDDPKPVPAEPTYALFRKLNDATGELRRHVMSEQRGYQETAKRQADSIWQLTKDMGASARRNEELQRRIGVCEEEIAALKVQLSAGKRQYVAVGQYAPVMSDVTMHEALDSMHTRVLIAEKQAEMRLADCQQAEAELAASKQRVRELEAKLNNVRDMLVQGGTP